MCIFIYTLLLVYVLESCRSEVSHAPNLFPQTNDLVCVKEKGELTAIVNPSPHAYYLQQGKPSGYTYEMLKSFADYLEVDLNIVVSHSLTESFALLAQGKASVLAEGLSITSQRKKDWLFGPDLMQIQQILVQKLPRAWYNIGTLDEIDSHLVKDICNLKGKTIYVPTASVYADRLQHIVDDTGSNINIIDTILSVDKLIALVAKDSIDYTVCDDYTAFYNKVIYPNIDIRTKIGNYRQRVSWAVPKGADSLQLEMQRWLQHIKKNKSFYYIYNKYYDNPYYAQQVKKEIHRGIFNKRLSPYDNLIKKYSRKFGWDWRLIASLICQESGFKNKTNPVSGAFGLMQMMPKTAKVYHVNYFSTVEKQIAAGIGYLSYLDKQMAPKIFDSTQRQKFVLAAYNVGMGHVFDAMRLAAKYGKDDKVWYHNVEDYMLLLSKEDYYTDSVCFYGYCRGVEPYNYVREIEDRYRHYCNLLVEDGN